MSKLQASSMGMSNKHHNFLFMHLPPEIRNMIYGLLFDLPKPGSNHTVLPTTPASAPNLSSKRKRTYFSPGLVLLRVCRSEHAEVTAMLYSRTVFAFDDVPAYSFDPTVHAKVSPCGINSMYTFVQIIGTRNRGLLRYIRVRMSNPHYLYYDHEAVPGFHQSANGGKCLGDAFELLSRAHTLRIITFQLMPPTNHGTGGLPSLLHHLLRPEEDSRMLQQLSKIRGNVNIRFRGHKMTELEIPEDLQMRCAMLKSLLARPREIKSVPEEVQHIENGKHDIVQKVLGASRRYSDLVQQISVEENQVKEWEALQVQIEAAKERIKSLTTEKQAIEKGLQDIQERVAGFPVPSS